MSEDVKTVVRRFFDEISAGNLGVIDEMMTDDFVEHEVFPGTEPTKEGVKQFFSIFRAAFPDLRMEANEIVAESELVAVRGTATGTNSGEFMGMPATGKRIEVEFHDLLRVRDGRYTEHWGVFDSMTMMQQLGAIPAPAAA